MKSINKTITYFLIFILFTSGLCVYSKYYLEDDKQYICEKEGEDYIVSFYDKKRKQIYEVIFPKEPSIKELGNDIVEIKIILGNPNSYVFYFNQKTLQISSTYYNATEIGGKYIAYMDDTRLIVHDIFSEGVLYEEIIRNFSVAANPLIDIQLIKVEDREFLHFEYVEGKDYQIIEESLEIFPNNT